MMRRDNPVNPHEIEIKLEVARILSVTARYNFFLFTEIRFASLFDLYSFGNCTALSVLHE